MARHYTMVSTVGIATKFIEPRDIPQRGTTIREDNPYRGETLEDTNLRVDNPL